MVDYHKKYLKYKQKHLMSKMNTFTGGTTDETIQSINTVVTEAAKATKIINKDGTLTSLTQMNFKETQNDNCNNTATLIKQVPCLSVKISADKKRFDLESTDKNVVTFTTGSKVNIKIGNDDYKADITETGEIKNIEEVNAGPAGQAPPLVGGKYIIKLTDAHLQIVGAKMHTEKSFKECTITFDIDASKPAEPFIVKDTVKLEMDKPAGP